MEQMLSRFPIGPRIFAGFGLVLALLLMVAGQSVFELSNSLTTFKNYNGLARNTEMVGRLQVDLLSTRVGVNEFIIKGNDEAIAAVEERLARAKAFIDEAKSKLLDPARVKDISAVETGLNDYERIFGEVIALQGERNRLADLLDDVGPKIRGEIGKLFEAAYNDGALDGIYSVGTTLDHLLSARLNVQEYLIRNDEKTATAARAALEKAQKSMEVLVGDLADPAQQEAVKQAAGELSAYAGTFEQLVEVIGERNARVREALDVVGPRVAELIGTVDKSVQQELDELGPTAIARAERAQLLDVIVSALSLLLGVAVAFVIARSIARPVSRMTDTMQSLAQGELDVEVPATDYRDEIGRMANAVQVFKDNAVAQHALEAEQENARQAKEARDKRRESLMQEFDSEISELLGFLASSSTELDTTARSMTQLAEQSSHRAGDVAAASEEATTNVQSVASASEEMDASISEISQQVNQSQGIANQAAQETTQAKSTVDRLVERSESISRVVELIADIAEQTNLLALNATIEAARAGDAGKGFAVVASEVKNLASQTAKATEEIASDVQAMQGVSQDAARGMDSVKEIISRVQEIATAIAGAVEEQSASTREIAHSTQQAAAGTQEVSARITDVSKAASDTGAAAQQVMAAADQLSTQSQRMRQRVESFLEGVRAA